ncbi:hypothetical protein FXO09_22605 [Microcystis aeruginosa KLA2]|uniref:Uncharacterized protein n=1 Tax=Microcystis aeruginosa KW TaxID=1960155 RepID=A0A1V4C012_MICAE|nr:hypothetical protein B1L04_02435 [Microcystis aeruginosa KW]TYT69057.1 hypothetical protein FXO09_22605 [Microcystis aeruginosa KLA2]
MSDAPLIKGGLKGGLRGDRHPPYQGGQGGSNLKSIFNLIITSYLYLSARFICDEAIRRNG